MARSQLSVVFAGSGGAGAMTAGALFLRAAAKAGYYGLMTQLFGPQVRGGEAAALVQISTEPVESQPDYFDLFIALDWDKVGQFAPEIPLGPSSLIIADPASGSLPASLLGSGARFISVAMQSKTKGSRSRSSSNIFAAGLATALAGVDAGSSAFALERVFEGKPEEVMAASRAALASGAAAAEPLKLDLKITEPNPKARCVITGNEAIGLGALRAGVRFVACYPITPATDLVEWLSPHLQGLGGRLVLAEDEIASINMILGASYGGVPAMTVTSGPGLSLMLETLGLAVAAEIPAVIVDVMRAGPSTGIPSKTEQSDLNIAIYGTHGDAPHVVFLAPFSVADCVATAEWAVYVAESLQSPVILLSDQALGQSRSVISASLVRPEVQPRRTMSEQKGAAFKRYAIGPDPITPMPAPGTPGCQWVAEGLTHDEVGLPAGAAAIHVAQLQKRASKIDGFDPKDMWGTCWGEGDTAIIAFGSSIGAAKVAAQRLAGAGHSIRVIGLRVLSPVPKATLAAALRGSGRVIVLEQNHGAQLYRHLLGHKAVPPSAESFARPGPLPFRPTELVSLITKEGVT